MIKKSVNAFPFYSKIEHQDRYKNPNSGFCGINLFSPADRFLNFQFLCTEENLEVEKIELCFSQINKVNLTNNKDVLKVIHKDVGTYVQYTGAALLFNSSIGPMPLQLEETLQWLEITMSNGEKAYSELFKPQKDLDPLLRIDYKTEGDLYPILYNEGFIQEIYLDTKIHAEEPEIEEETKENAKGKVIPISQKLINNYKINTIAPDFLKIALTSLQMHREVNITTPFNSNYIEVSRVVVTNQLEANGELTRVELSIRQILLTLSACNAHIN